MNMNVDVLQYIKYVCLVCGESWETPQATKWHVQEEHKNFENLIRSFKYGCSFCEEVRSQKSCIIKHIKRDHFEKNQELKTPKHITVNNLKDNSQFLNSSIKETSTSLKIIYANGDKDVFEITELPENSIKQSWKSETQTEYELYDLNYYKEPIAIETLSEVGVNHSNHQCLEKDELTKNIFSEETNNIISHHIDINEKKESLSGTSDFKIKTEPLIEESKTKSVTNSEQILDITSCTDSSQLEILDETLVKVKIKTHLEETKMIQGHKSTKENLICFEKLEKRNIVDNFKTVPEVYDNSAGEYQVIKVECSSDTDIEYESFDKVTVNPNQISKSYDLKQPLKPTILSANCNDSSKRLQFKEIIKFACKECDECTDTYEIYLEHFLDNHKDTGNPITFWNYKCGICSEFKATESEMESHIRSSHNGDEIFTCDLCLKNFDVKADFYVHKKKHSISNLHKCEMCGKIFSNSSDLNAHSVTHLLKRTHKCCYCNQTYKHKTTLHYHYRFKHSVGGSFSCLICSKLYKSNSSLLRHTKRMHNINYYLDPQKWSS